MLTYNVDTIDCLTNGMICEVLDFEFGKGRTVSRIIVHFPDQDYGKKRRQMYPYLLQKYPDKNAAFIERLEFPYSFTR